MLVSELREMNNDVLENQKDGISSLKDSELFKKQYAAILVQLRDADEQVSPCLYVQFYSSSSHYMFSCKLVSSLSICMFLAGYFCFVLSEAT